MVTGRKGTAPGARPYADHARRTGIPGPGRSGSAADVVQRTFLKVVLNARGFEGRSALRTWVWRIASNEASQWLRERSRDRRRLDALAQLSERDRDLLEFFTSAERGAIDRLSAEIGVCARTIRTRLHRARQRLRQALASGD